MEQRHLPFLLLSEIAGAEACLWLTIALAAQVVAVYLAQEL